MKNEINRALVAKKKIFLALMAVAAIALTGCKDNGNEPDQKKQEEQKQEEKSPYIYAFYMSQPVLNCTQYFIDEGDGKGEQALDASKWMAFNKETEEGKWLVRNISELAAISGETIKDADWANLRQYVIYDTKERDIKITRMEIDTVKTPTANSRIIYGKPTFTPTTVGGASGFGDYTYIADSTETNVANITKFATKIVTRKKK